MLQTNKPLIKNNTFLTPFEIFIGSSLHILLLQSIVCFNFYDYTKKKDSSKQEYSIIRW